VILATYEIVTDYILSTVKCALRCCAELGAQTEWGAPPSMSYPSPSCVCARQLGSELGQTANDYANSQITVDSAICRSGLFARATRSVARAGLNSTCKVLIESLGSIIQKKSAPTESSFRLRLPPTLRVSCLRNHKCTHSCKSFSYRTW
jgi:hypothetical protein